MTTTEAITAKLDRALLDLGDSPETVAAYLTAQGIRGLKRRAAYCPVATFLSAACGYPVSVSHISGHATIDRALEAYAHFEVPKPVGTFITRFDRGDYPALQVQA